MDITAERVREIQKITQLPLALEAPVGEDGERTVRRLR